MAVAASSRADGDRRGYLPMPGAARSGQQVPLSVGDPEGGQVPQIVDVLDPFGTRGQAEILCVGDEGAQDGGAGDVRRAAIDKRTVDLDDVRPEGGQSGEFLCAGAGSDIVERDSSSGRPQPRDRIG